MTELEGVPCILVAFVGTCAAAKASGERLGRHLVQVGSGDSDAVQERPSERHSAGTDESAQKAMLRPGRRSRKTVPRQDNFTEPLCARTGLDLSSFR